jgi:hypothetical protein
MYKTVCLLIIVSTMCLSAAHADLVEVDTSPTSAWNGFNTIGSPSSIDLANGAFTTLELGTAHSTASNIDPGLLTDGLFATNNNHFSNTSDNNLNRIFFGPDNGNTEYRIMVSLDDVYDIGSINVYSWHAAGRSDQTYQVHFTDEFLPTTGDLSFSGWSSLGGFNTSGNGTDTQVVTSFEDGGAVIASAQFVIFSFEANSNNLGTYLTEIDIIQAVPEPASCVGLLGLALACLSRRKRR